jgi:hypothetical protein
MEADGFFHLGIVALKRRSGRMVARRGAALQIAEIKIGGQAVYALGVDVIAIEAELEAGQLGDDDGTGHSRTQPENAQQRVEAVLPDGAQRGFQVIEEHAPPDHGSDGGPGGPSGGWVRPASSGRWTNSFRRSLATGVPIEPDGALQISKKHFHDFRPLSTAGSFLLDARVYILKKFTIISSPVQLCYAFLSAAAPFRPADRVRMRYNDCPPADTLPAGEACRWRGFSRDTHPGRL